MKKVPCLLLLFALVFCLTACQAEKSYSIEPVTTAGTPTQYRFFDTVPKKDIPHLRPTELV